MSVSGSLPERRSGHGRGAGWRALSVLVEETSLWSPRIAAAQMVSGLLPLFVGNRLRARLLRAAGFRVGRGTVIFGPVTFTGTAAPAKRVDIGSFVVINFGCVLDAAADIRIGDRVGIGQEVMILTNGHDIGPPSRRLGPLRARPVTVGDGAWLSTRAVILPGVTIGEGSVVAAGAVVTHDVLPHTLVGGTPARVIRKLPT